MLKRSVVYQANHYEVVLIREDDGGYSVSVPDVPGAYSDGDTEAEAMENIVDAIAMLEESREEVAVILQSHGSDPEEAVTKLALSLNPETEQA